MLPRSIHRVLPSSALALALGACSGLLGRDGQTIRPQLMRVAGSGASAHISNFDPPVGGGYAWSSDIAITSFRAPIRGITLRGSDNSTSIYTCSANSNDGCLVELAGPALQDVLGAAPVTVRQGTYTAVEIYTCGQGETAYHAFLSGSVSLGGTSYGTSTGSTLAAGGSAEPVSIEYQGCARSYPLPVPLVIGDSAGAPVSFRLYFDIRDLAWASLGETETAGGWLPGGCAGPRPGDASTGGVATPYLCTGYPDVAGVVDVVPPVVERYRINDAATIGLLFRASGGEFIGGYSRRFFAEGAAATPGFNPDTPVQEWSSNGDGSYHLSTFGGSGPGGAPVGHYLVMPSFFRATHSGNATAQDSNPFAYSAVRLE